MGQVTYVQMGPGGWYVFFEYPLYDMDPGDIAISSNATGEIQPQEGYVYTPRNRGIDACGATLEHEFRHKTTFEAAWGGYSEAQIGQGGCKVYHEPDDEDGDGIKDDYEANTPWWDQPPNAKDKYFLNKKHDGNAWEPDWEFDADVNGARMWPTGALNAYDWACPGKQSKPPY